MKPEEITELFETMATSLRAVQQPPARPTDGIPEHARQPAPPKAPEVTKDDLKAMFDPASDKFDPEAAFKLLAARNYGPLIGDINLRSIRGMFAQFRGELPDFKDFEQEISQAITQSGRDPSTLTERDVLTYYFTAKGMKSTLKERQEAASRAASTHQPSPAAQPTKEPELSDVEVEVANRMFRRIKDPALRIKEYKKFAGYDDGITVKVPIGGGKTE